MSWCNFFVYTYDRKYMLGMDSYAIQLSASGKIQVL